MEPNSPSRDKLPKARSLPFHGRIAKFCLVVIAIMLLSAGTYYVLFGLKKSDEVPGRPYFSVVIDCGSTGTRVNVYKWALKAGTSSKRLPILLHSYPDNLTEGWKSGCRYHCMQTEPGLDKFLGNSSGIRASLEPLIHWAEGVVPSERHQETPILVLATAGLRSLPARDEEWILEDVGCVIKDHRFAYRKSRIRVLSGQEEAYFGWVALNYKMGILNSSSPAMTTLGLLDLGGSSLQIVREVDELEDANWVLRSDIGGKRNELLAVSLPEFGLNEAFDRSVAMLSAEDQGEGFGEVLHPCLGSTFVQNYTCNNCLEQRSKHLERRFNIVENKLSSLVHVVGDPNMELCERLVKAAALNVSFSDWSKTKTFLACKGGLSSVDGMTALGIAFKSDPNNNLRFHALSGFFVVYNMLDLAERASINEIWSKAQQLCSRLWTDAKNFPNKQQHPAAHYCFKVMYMVSLIRDTLCLGDSEIVFGPGDISWTLGASLVEQEKSLDSRTSQTFSGILSIKYQKVLFSPVPLFFLLVLVLFIVYHYQVKLPMPQQRRSAASAPVLPSYNHFRQRPR